MRQLIIFVVLSLIAISVPGFARDLKQESFNSPQAAFKALVTAARTDDVPEMLAIFGSKGKDIISSGDPVADRKAREGFVTAADEAVSFSKIDKRTVLVSIGKDSCSFPVPIVRSGKKWLFDTDEGRQEIVNRRIGRNELSTIRVAGEYVKAQQEYAKISREENGVSQYASRFMSSKGKKDGLYWETKPGEEPSPLGVLVAHAAEEGYLGSKQGGKPRPYHGYYYKILKSQGSSAPNSRMDYIVDGKMTAGFGLVAYPAIYGVSGIKTFMVNQEGIVYEKDLGPNTGEIAKTIAQYNPDSTWKKTGPGSR